MNLSMVKKHPTNLSPESNNSSAPIRVIIAVILFCLTSGQTQAIANVVVWDSSTPFGNNVNFENRTAWKQVPANLLNLETDPAKAASDPAYYGREYAFKGDVVLENRSYLAAFSSSDGKVTFFSKGQPAKVGGSPDTPAIPGRSVAVLLPLDSNPLKTKIERVRLLRNTGDEAVLEVVFSGRDAAGSTAVFIFGRNEIVEIHPSRSMTGIRLQSPIEYGVVPDFIGDDLLYGRDKQEKSQMNLPAENMFLGLLRGEDRMLVVTWPDGGQKLRLGSGSLQADGPPIESVDLENDGQSVFFAILAAPGIWHREELKPTYLEKEIKTTWQRPFPAKWVTQLDESGVMTRFSFRESHGRIWRGVSGAYGYPVWFDGEAAMYLLSKKIPPKGESIVYFLEGRNTPISIRTPVDILKETLGRPFSRTLLDDAGRILRSHHRRGSEGVRRACTCGATEAIQAVFESRQEVAKSVYIDQALDDMIYFVERHLERIDEYLKFGDAMTAFLRAKEQAEPTLKPFIEDVAWIAAQIRDEHDVQKENMKSMEHARELALETMSLTRKSAAGNLAVYKELLKKWRAMGGAQDYLLARCHATTRRLAQESGYACVNRPEAVNLAEEIRRRCRRVLRNPDGYEIWADY